MAFCMFTRAGRQAGEWAGGQAGRHAGGWVGGRVGRYVLFEVQSTGGYKTLSTEYLRTRLSPISTTSPPDPCAAAAAACSTARAEKPLPRSGPTQPSLVV